jgi:hypothetical protein
MQAHHHNVIRRNRSGFDALDAPAVSDEFLVMCENPGACAALPFIASHACAFPCFKCVHQSNVFAGTPPHTLQLSVGCVAMITEGNFKNGRHVVVHVVHSRTVTVVDADAYCKHVNLGDEYPLLSEGCLLVPRILFQWHHRRIGLCMQRRQFPLATGLCCDVQQVSGGNTSTRGCRHEASAILTWATVRCSQQG